MRQRKHCKILYNFFIITFSYEELYVQIMKRRRVVETMVIEIVTEEVQHAKLLKYIVTRPNNKMKLLNEGQ